MKEFKLEIDGRTSYVRINDLPGRGRPIVFIPGWGCTGSFDFVEMASQESLLGHRRILIDLLGSGFSDRPLDFDYRPESHAQYIGQLIDLLGLEDFYIYAHSMGGRIGLSLAEDLGPRLRGLILSEGSMVEEFFPYMDQGEEAFVEELFPRMITRLARKEDQMFLASARLCSPQALYREAREMMEPASLKWEKLFFQGQYRKAFIVGSLTDDEGFDLGRISQQEDIDLIEIEGANHTVNWELPREAAQALALALGRMEEGDA